VECFGGWGKGEPGETRGWGSQHGPGGGGATGGEGPGGGELDGCIMHRVHTSVNKKRSRYIGRPRWVGQIKYLHN
jgi:hypothetical protein